MNHWPGITGKVVLLFALLLLFTSIARAKSGQESAATTGTKGAYVEPGSRPGSTGANLDRVPAMNVGDEAENGASESTLGDCSRLPADQQSSDATAEKKKAEDAANRSKLYKSHLANGNDAMHEAQEIRRQIPAATGGQRTALVAKMKADYQTAIAEYEEALKNTTIADENSMQTFGLIRVIRDGLITQEKAVQMLTQDKNMPVLMSNVGLAYSGIEDYQDAIPFLQEATLIKAAPGTYMQLGTDLAAVGKVPDGIATCDKIPSADPAATDMQAACYRNIAVLLTNANKLPDAVAPLEKATQLNPKDALAWKLLGDALSNSITTKQQKGKMVYVIPPGTMEAYQQYLQLEPNGLYAGQVKATLEGFAQLMKAQ
jgi:tetratricopeptide (TPR) repeat protein